MAATIETVTGDITKITVDAIVNAANCSLMGGGGVDGAIHRAGGPAILDECRKIRHDRYPDGLPTGEAVATTAGDLPARWVIHTVGPVWHGGKRNEDDLLYAAYAKSHRLAAELGAKSIAYPAISTGVYGYPKHEACAVAVGAVAEWLGAHDLPRTVTFCCYGAADAALYRERLGTAR